MQRAIGLDLNGWRDHACRDWTAENPNVATQSVCIDGGTGTVIVEHGNMHVGGPEAILSPIGRGGGWGQVGAEAKRRHLADHWRDLAQGLPSPTFDGDVRAAVLALSQLATRVVLCIPDHEGFQEAAQKRLLVALTHRKMPKPTLVWRSVALVLGLLESGALPQACDGLRIACIVHGAAGLERQVLVLRRLTDHPNRLAPERATPGRLTDPALSLNELLGRAQAAVVGANPSWENARTEAPRMPVNLLFQEQTPEAEIIRRDNGDWVRLQPPAAFAPFRDLPRMSEFSIEADCTVVLTPLAARYHPALAELLLPGADAAPMMWAPPETVARGALLAARRIERGIPHYLDRLDPVAMVVMRRDGPVFADLIPAGASVPGDREYISEPLRGFVWPAGMAAVDFYLRKGTSEIRTWHVPIDAAPERNQPLAVQLRQTPAQGWATLSITAPDWGELRRTPIRLDWGSLTPEGRTEDTILDSLRGPRPAIPDRVHYKAHIGLWDGSLKRPGLSAVLRSFRPGDPRSLSELQAALSAPYSRPLNHPNGSAGPFFAVGTDGELPVEVGTADREAFLRTIDQIAEDLLHVIRTPLRPYDNNDAIRCLTWVFAACPSAIGQEVQRAFQEGVHRLLEPTRGVVVVTHGLGRITADAPTLARFLPDLIVRLPKTSVLPTLAAMLSRQAATPAILAGLDVDDAAGRLNQIFSDLVAIASYEANYKYAQLALAGLLRVREHQPWALTIDRSPAARAVAATLERAMVHLQYKRLKRQLATTAGLLEYLVTNEGRPDLLTLIDTDGTPASR